MQFKGCYKKELLQSPHLTDQPNIPFRQACGSSLEKAGHRGILRWLARHIKRARFNALNEPVHVAGSDCEASLSFQTLKQWQCLTISRTATTYRFTCLQNVPVNAKTGQRREHVSWRVPIRKQMPQMHTTSGTLQLAPASVTTTLVAQLDTSLMKKLAGLYWSALTWKFVLI